MTDHHSTPRRAFLGAVGVTALAGCVSTVERPRADETETPTETEQPTEPPADTEEPTETETEEPPEEPDSQWNLLGTPIEQFETDDRWEAVTDETYQLDDGTATDGSPEPLAGDYSMLVTSNGTTQITGAFRSAPLDLTDRTISVAVHPDAPDSSSSLHVWAFDPEGRKASFSGLYTGGFDSGWVRYDLRSGDYDAGFDFEYVTDLRIRTSTRGETRFWVDDIRSTPKPDRGKALVFFDDGTPSQYENGFELLQKHDLRAAYAIITDLVNSRNRLTTRKLNELEEAGCEIVSHSASHPRLSDISSEQKRRELLGSKGWIEENALNPETAGYIAYPENAYDRETLEIVGEHFEMGFAGGGTSAAAITDPRTIPRVDWERHSEAAVRRLIDRTAEARGLFSIYVHEVEGDTVQRLDDLFGYLADADLDVVVPTELNALQEDLAGR